MTKNILTVDDSPSMRQIIKSYLSRYGFNIQEAEDGLDALEKIKGGIPVDLFLVDVNMPNMDGISFVKELRKIQSYKGIPVLMLTTESMDNKKAEGAKAGATGWVVKPFDPDKFVKVIDRLLN